MIFSLFTHATAKIGNTPSDKAQKTMYTAHASAYLTTKETHALAQHRSYCQMLDQHPYKDAEKQQWVQLSVHNHQGAKKRDHRRHWTKDYIRPQPSPMIGNTYHPRQRIQKQPLPRT